VKWLADLNDFFDALSETEFDERPVGIEEFVSSPDYLGLETAPGASAPLSEHQYQMVRAGTQIYRKETLIELYGEAEGVKRWNQTCSECIFVLGKGSGKDFISTVICCYIVYLLLCLKNPQKYYGKPADNTIDILNVATNAEQAKNVFFKNLKKMIKNCPWFDGKYSPPTTNVIEFDKSISLYSGNSEREAFEGLNLFLAVLDEISGFATTESAGPQQLYDSYRDAVDSRFPDGVGKVLLLSFPRKITNDFIFDKYNEVVVEKEVIIKKHTLKLNKDLPDGYEGNEFEVEWEEDHITHYKYPMIFALKRPSWEVNPTKRIEMYTRNFHSNMANALAKFACMPQFNTETSFFKNQESIEESFVLINPVDDNGIFRDNFKPRPDTKYFMHVDLSKVHDRCAVGLAHVDNWVTIESGHFKETLPVVTVDCLRWWQPTKESPMDYKAVIQYILDVKKRGFDIRLVTFDRWDSIDTMNQLERQFVKTDRLSVANKHYDDFLSTLYDNRLRGPRDETLITELKELQYVKDKVDHPRSGYKDLSDAVCGAIYNAITHTPKPVSENIEVLTLDKLKARMGGANKVATETEYPTGVIRPPKGTAPPPEIRNYLSRLRSL
jgi:hypothetical protein